MFDGEGSLLDITQREVDLVGKSTTFTPKLINTPGVRIFTDTRALLKFGASAEKHPANVTVAVDAVQLDSKAPSVGDLQEVLIQGILRFGSGGTQHGEQVQTNVDLPVGPVTYRSQVLFDIGRGTFVTVNASYIELSILYRSHQRQSAEFALDPGTGTQIAGPTFKVHGTVGWFPKTNLGRVTYTDPVFPSFETPTEVTVIRAPFATEFDLLWDGGMGAAASLELEFWGATAGPATNPMLIIVTAGPYPVQRFQWPASAVAVGITPLDAGAVTNLQARQYLTL